MSAPALEAVEVSLRFGGNVALDDVSLDAAAGQVTGLIGPNGAGKTTLFNVVCGLLKPDRGTVRLLGDDITRLPTHARARAGLARTFQRLELFGVLTAHGNVRVAADLARRRGAHRGQSPDEVAAALLDRVGLAAVAEVRADQLPTGQARLVELARALATQPSVLLLDEPASGLDESETTAFGGLLRELAGEGMAVFLVEHDVSLVMAVCDRVHVLDVGRVLASGTAAEVRADTRVHDAYLGVVTA
jgi:branched-chain amino acid transport system ATP-binding protein